MNASPPWRACTRPRETLTWRPRERWPSIGGAWQRPSPAAWKRWQPTWRWSARDSTCDSATRCLEAAWSPRGIDQAEFFVSPNPGEELRPLARIVSGGELSRLMLAIKTLTATSRAGWTESADRAPSGVAPGLIFDEVDAGIGGRVADVVGRKLRALGSAFQVLCITHLPQIAAVRRHTFRDRKARRTRTDADVGRSARPRRPRGGDRPDARRREDQRRAAVVSPGDAREWVGGAGRPEAGEERTEAERRKRKGESERWAWRVST